MIRKVLIANRGEIACRIIRTLDRLGIASVAVYSEADRDAMHVAMAGESVMIGPAAAASSYLQIDRLVDAARQTCADAVHPGYGFLSENPEFVESLHAAGIKFIGPNPDAIRAMGLKDAAKIAMEKAGVPVVPGYHSESQDDEILANAASEIGYPVLIKARAGGGGKGMRLVHDHSGFSDALAAARRESLASFGDDHVLIEKFVASPRHIEVQVFGDSFGDVVYLHERDCSLQRRHQKVIEEAPAPGMTLKMRSAMGEAAVAAAKAVNYVGAGTVEFIVDASDGLRPDRFYFMEMNTRLQVEHPVTEAITGLDLVEWQVAVANGEALPLKQNEIQLNGHAFEARLYAEDADNGFLPTTGTLDFIRFPEFARVDTGVREGDTITPFYDPMIAKIIVHEENRKLALDALKKALSASRIAGCTTNIGFLGRLCNAESFVHGAATTTFIDDGQDSLKPAANCPAAVITGACLLHASMAGEQRETCPWHSLYAWQNWGLAEKKYRISINGESFSTSLKVINNTTGTLKYRDSEFEFRIINDQYCHQHGDLQLSIDGGSFDVGWYRGTKELAVFFAGQSYRIIADDPLSLSVDSAASGNEIVSPMPGLIVNVVVEVGTDVEEGDSILQMEAMKMEHNLTAPRDGTVKMINVSIGDQVGAGQILVSFSEETSVEN